MLSRDALWRTTVGNRTTSPHKTGTIGLLHIPGIRTRTISTDPMHTFHIGWGQDLAASGVILLATVGAFGQGSLDSRLEVAYASFIAFCSAHGKTTSCDRFSKQTFDMKHGLNLDRGSGFMLTSIALGSGFWVIFVKPHIISIHPKPLN